jgi:hypothetical protein
MPEIRAILEFDYLNSGNVAVPADDQIEHEFYPPEGWAVISWGVTSMSPELHINSASISPGVDDVPRFIGIIVNTDLSNSHSLRFTYVLLKL